MIYTYLVKFRRVSLVVLLKDADAFVALGVARSKAGKDGAGRVSVRLVSKAPPVLRDGSEISLSEVAS